MFSKWKKQWQLKNEVMDKLLKLLDNLNDWTYDDRLEYKHNESDIVINWGYESGYDGGGYVKRIESPIIVGIPRRFRKRVGGRLEAIRNRDRSPDDLSFLNEYMDGNYVQKIRIDKDKKSEITVWMMENKITEYHIMYSTIWFKNEEDAMAVKLVWE